jgi:hypothetical protein
MIVKVAFKNNGYFMSYFNFSEKEIFVNLSKIARRKQLKFFTHS